MTIFKLVAASAMGLEAIVAQEVKDLGYETTVENGKVYFEGDETAIARCNLWLRVADRVKIVVAQFPARSFEELFESVKAIQWEKYLPVDAAFPVSGKSVKSKLFSVPDCQAITKKATISLVLTSLQSSAELPLSALSSGVTAPSRSSAATVSELVFRPQVCLHSVQELQHSSQHLLSLQKFVSG